MNEPIVTTLNGYFKPGLPGRVVAFDGLRTVYLGEACHRTEIPEYTVELLPLYPGGKPSRMQYCQAGRDFDFVNQRPAA